MIKRTVYISALYLVAAPMFAAFCQVTFSESAPYAPRVFTKQGEKKNIENQGHKAARVKPETDAAELDLTIPVSVIDMNARLVTGLKKTDFTVFVDDREMELVSSEPDDGPLSIVLMLDLSPSAVTRLDGIKSLAQRMVENLRPQDMVMIVGFAANLSVKTDFTSDRKAIAKAIRGLEMGNGTALYTGLAELFTRKLDQRISNAAIVLMTDGVDTVSRKFNYESSLATVEKTSATVFPIYLDTFEDAAKASLPSPGFVGIFPQSKGIKKAEYDLGRNYLTDLVKLSGGRPVAASPVLAGSTTAYDSIPDQLRARYQLRCRLSVPLTHGTRSSVRIRVNKPNLVIFAKGSLLR